MSNQCKFIKIMTVSYNNSNNCCIGNTNHGNNQHNNDKDNDNVLIGAIDQGTSSTRFIVFDKKGNLVTQAGCSLNKYHPKVGYVEQNADEIIQSIKTCIQKVIQHLNSININCNNIKTIGITNQRESVVCFDKKTGKALNNVIVWSDTRTDKLVEKFRFEYEKHNYQNKTGLIISGYFSALKIRWLLDNNPLVKEALENDSLCIGTVDTWILYNLNKLNNKHNNDNDIKLLTDVTNASRTMLMDLKTLNWSTELLKFFDIPISILPDIKSCSEIYFNVKNLYGLKDVFISGCIGDQQAALLGQKCFTKGSAKNTYGTGCFLLFNIGNEILISKNKLLTTVAYKLGKNKEPVYAIEGSVAVAGSALTWLRDDMQLFKSYQEIDKFAESVDDTAGVYFVTAFSGLFAPYWRPDAKGCISGLTQYSNKGHIARASLEATCFQIKEIIESIKKDGNQNTTTNNNNNIDQNQQNQDLNLIILKADGGISKSNICMQLQADILGIDVEKSSMPETTALGAAMAAGLAVGIWKDIKDLKNLNQNQNAITTFSPKSTSLEREKKFKEWKKAISKSYS